MDVYQILLLTLLYFVAGLLFSLVYLVNFRPNERSPFVGLAGLFWPVFLLFDVILLFAGAFGNFSKYIHKRVVERSKNSIGFPPPPPPDPSDFER